MSTSETVLWWRQLLADVGYPSETGEVGIRGQYAKARCESLIDLYFACCNVLSAEVMLEIGAFTADTSKRFLSEGLDRRAYAFEASPANYAENLGKASGVVGLSYIHKAVGATRGQVDFRVARDPTYRIWGSAAKRQGFDEVDVVSVEMTTVDSFFESIQSPPSPRRVAAWIDVEGLGFEVLDGASKALQRDICVVFIEMNDFDLFQTGKTALQVIEKFLDAGFVPIARDNEYSDAWNMLVVHSDIYQAVNQTLTKWLYAEARKSLDLVFK